MPFCRVRLKCDGTHAETRFRLSLKRTSPFKSAGASVQSTTGSRGVCTSGSNAGHIMFRGSVKSTGYPLHSPVSPSLPLPYVTECHHVSYALYLVHRWWTCSVRSRFNTFAASYLNTQGLNISWLKSPASTLVDLTFQSRALRSFSLNQLCNQSL